MQFHPTCLYNLEVKNLLITEAVRGEGGHLKHPITGERFMAQYDERLELAPRDIVARAIDDQIKRDGLDYVHLDISHQPAQFVRTHFPTINEKLLGLGIDMTKDPIPVVPAQHYTCGGVLIDLAGRTDLPGLYAAGECTESGLHGANRLASNGLLEAAVLGRRAADDVAAGGGDPMPGPRVDPLPLATGDADGSAVRHMVGRIMWDGCGLERDADGLADAAGRLDALPMPADAESAGLLEVARLVVAAAAAREESRGAHFRSDFPDSDPTLARRTCWAGDTPAAMPSIDLTEAA